MQHANPVKTVRFSPCVKEPKTSKRCRDCSSSDIPRRGRRRDFMHCTTCKREFCFACVLPRSECYDCNEKALYKKNMLTEK